MEFVNTHWTWQKGLSSRHHRSNRSVFVESGCGTASHSRCMSLRNSHAIELNAAPDEWLVARLHGSFPCDCKMVLPSQSKSDSEELGAVVF